MSTVKVLLLLVTAIFISAVTGGLAGYYAALKTPSVSNIAVLDFDELAKTVNPDAPDALQRAAKVAAKSKAITKRLAEAGMVVIDRANVLDAPPEAIVHVDASTN